MYSLSASSSSQVVNRDVVQDVREQSSIALTLNKYSHVVPTLRHEAAGQMEGPVSGQPMHPMARWLLAWMLGTESPLASMLTPFWIWCPDGKMVAAAGFEPATKGL